MRNDSYQSILDSLLEEDRLRSIPSDQNCGKIDLCTNDYLALTPKYREFMPEFLDLYGDAPFSASASRLLCPSGKYHRMLEEFLSLRYNKRALLFNSGYHANVGCVQALAARANTIFLCDRLIHASVIDGLMMSKAKFERWRHNDIDHLSKLLNKYRSEGCNIVIVAESVYSMDGDLAPLHDLTALKRHYPDIILYLDEAHGIGVFGDRGLGLAESLGLIDEIDIIIGTFGKACASQGAFAATSDTMHDVFVNLSRPFIFSTAIPPVNCAWTLFMLGKIENMSDCRDHLINTSQLFRDLLEQNFCKTIASRSQIVPFVTGSAESAVSLASFLGKNGIDALPIRKPTVASGTERIRFSFNADITPDVVYNVVDLIKRFYNVN